MKAFSAFRAGKRKYKVTFVQITIHKELLTGVIEKVVLKNDTNFARKHS